jgi:hypothetical protein
MILRIVARWALKPPARMIPVRLAILAGMMILAAYHGGVR